MTKSKDKQLPGTPESCGQEEHIYFIPAVLKGSTNMDVQSFLLHPPAPATEYVLFAASGIRWLLCKLGIVSPVDSFPLPPVLLLLFVDRVFSYFASFGTSSQKISVYWTFVGTCLVVWLTDLLRMQCSIPWLIAGGAYFMSEPTGRKVMLLLCSLDLLGLRILTVAQTVSLTYAVFVFSILYMAVIFVFGLAIATAALNPEILEGFMEGFRAGLQQQNSPVTNA